MLVVAGRVRINPAKREEAIAAATEMMRESNKEEGCITYVLSADLGEPGLFRIFEEWESEAALGAHFKTPHMAAFNKAMGSFEVQEIEVKQYEVATSKQLMP